ncbi:MAG: hypothetical protein LBQ76_08325 [Candidatus Fibromonas sp.]|jgi:hypothetical protein|nr:hypothetical protein [Candidatus Fibromonas sp.]
MKKVKFTFAALTAVLAFSCTTTQIGLKENWIDERDVIALKGASVSKWMETAGRPTLVEINGDTSIYYYNYKPTMYAAVVYDSTTFFKSWGTASESKPSLANATEVWGSRKNVMQIKVVNDAVISAVITDGPDKKVFVRDLNGDIVLDPTTGFNPNISEEQKISDNSKEFGNAYNSVHGKDTWPPKGSAPDSASAAGQEASATGKEDAGPTQSNPWENYRYRQEKIEAAREAENTYPPAEAAEESTNPPTEATEGNTNPPAEAPVETPPKAHGEN